MWQNDLRQDNYALRPRQIATLWGGFAIGFNQDEFCAPERLADRGFVLFDQIANLRSLVFATRLVSRQIFRLIRWRGIDARAGAQWPRTHIILERSPAQPIAGDTPQQKNTDDDRYSQKKASSKFG